MDRLSQDKPDRASSDATQADNPACLAEHRSVQAHIEALEASLARHARERAELVHLVSHELRTPITVISGFGKLLQAEAYGALNEDQHRFVGESLKACRRLDQFVEDLLEASPDSATPFGVVTQSGDLHETIACQLESLAPLLEERGIKVEAGLHAETPRLDYDERRIEQVITNLMTNAIRYASAHGVIRIETRSTPGMIEVSVEDDGPGIPEEDRERLFEPYVRGAAPSVEDDETMPRDTGLGIGLAISRRIIDAHQGRISVHAGSLGGARFVFSLPFHRTAGKENNR